VLMGHHVMKRCSLTCSAHPLMSHCSIRTYMQSTDHFRSTSALTEVVILMDKMAPLICEDRQSVENNIRVCLSTNKCFVKIPVVPGAQDSKRNYWKLDYSQITGKMVRRHFKGIMHLFPELASKVETEKLNRQPEHQPAACRAVQVRSEVKFSSPFSIESLLKRDSPSAQASTASPPSSVTLRAEQQQLRSAGIKRSFSWDSEERLLLQPPSGSSSICSAGGSTYHGATAAGAAESIRRMSECSEASFPVYTRARAAPYFSSQHSSYITYSVPAFTHDALQFWL
uniref:Fork-head domain-containing protein n=1 Tax=Amphiprion ocellaris TaxID=80972 RepID=A0A3Q1D1U0_AMPOC